jgi:hypothetical protein
MPCQPRIRDVNRDPPLQFGRRLTARRTSGPTTWRVELGNDGVDSGDVNVTVRLTGPVTSPGLDTEFAGRTTLAGGDTAVGVASVTDSLNTFPSGDIGVSISCTPLEVDGDSDEWSFNVRLVG